MTRDYTPEFNRIESRVKEENARMYLLDKILHADEMGITDALYGGREIVVSLTSHGKRLDEVCFTIESIMQQTCKPNKILLYLDEPDAVMPLPVTLQKQQKRGLTVLVTPENIKSYKKLLPALSNFPESVIVTVDDDAYYEFDLLERLIRAYLQDSSSIYAARTHVMTFDEAGRVRPYKQWSWCTGKSENPKRVFFTGVGGVLYPPHSLDGEVLNAKVFMDVCPTADDVWFNAMALKKGTLVCKIPTRNSSGNDFTLNSYVQDCGLAKLNVDQGGNDMQINTAYETYHLFEKLR
jgi:hypothetical protein